jgi:hypothetical protein
MGHDPSFLLGWEPESLQAKLLLELLENKKNGYYVELGAFHSQVGSNTWDLETQHDWNGVSFEIVPEFHEEFVENRKNPCILGDATLFNYTKYFEENNFPKQIDFLQVDIDASYNQMGRPQGDPYQSLKGLIALPLNTYRFTFITFEHDACIDYKAEAIRDAQREILYSYGYNMIRRTKDEDWWVDPTVIPYNNYRTKIRTEVL